MSQKKNKFGSSIQEFNNKQTKSSSIERKNHSKSRIIEESKESPSPKKKRHSKNKKSQEQDSGKKEKKLSLKQSLIGKQGSDEKEKNEILKIFQKTKESALNTVSYLRPVKADGKDSVSIQLHNWTNAENEESLMKKFQRKKQNQGQGYTNILTSKLNNNSIQSKTQKNQKQVKQKIEQIKINNELSIMNKRDSQNKRINDSQESDRNHSASKSRPNSRGLKSSGRGGRKNSLDKQRKESQSNSPIGKKKKGYMDQLADQEAKLISMNSLQEGEEFEKDINNIIEIIDGVEKTMCQQKLNNQFIRNANLSNNRRKIEMTRTIQAQINHQNNFFAKQAQIQQQQSSLISPQIPISQQYNLISEKNQQFYKQKFPNVIIGSDQQKFSQTYNNNLFSQSKIKTQRLEKNNQGDKNNYFSNQDMNQKYRYRNNQYQTDNVQNYENFANGIIPTIQRHASRKMSKHKQASQTLKNLGVRISKKRPMTTKNAINVEESNQNINSQGQGALGSMSGAFQVINRHESLFKREISGGENTSDIMTQDNQTSAVTGAAINTAAKGYLQFQNQNPKYISQYLQQNPTNSQYQDINIQNSNNNIAGHEIEFFSDQSPPNFLSRNDIGIQGGNEINSQIELQEPFMSPKINKDSNNKDRVASAKEFQTLNRYRDLKKNYQSYKNSNQVKSQLNVGQQYNLYTSNNNNFNESNTNISGSPNRLKLKPINQNIPMNNLQTQIPQNQNEYDAQYQTAILLYNQSNKMQDNMNIMNSNINQDNGQPVQQDNVMSQQYQAVSEAFQQQLQQNLQSLTDQYVNGNFQQNQFSNNNIEYLKKYLLADNTTINPQNVDQQLDDAGISIQIQPSGNNFQKKIKSPQNKLVMQVNQYIPHFLRIPTHLTQKDLHLFQQDYTNSMKQIEIMKPGESLIKDDSEKKIVKKGSPQLDLLRNKKFDIVDEDEIKKQKEIQNHIINFDKVIIQSIFGNREKKFNEQYRNRGSKLNQENSYMQSKIKSRVGGTLGTTMQSSIDQKNDQLGYDSDEERENAHQMFIDDIQKLRQYFKNTLEEQIQIQDQMLQKFNEERKIFLSSASTGLDELKSLNSKIVQLKNELQEERNYSQKVWADEQVSLMCQKALFTYKFMNKNQAQKVHGLDIRDYPDGNIIVTEIEQNNAFNKLYQVQMDQASNVKESNQSISKSSDNKKIEINKKQSNKSIGKDLKIYDNYELNSQQNQQSERQDILEKQNFLDQQSEISVIPSPHIEKHKLEIESLKWQIEYEKKLYNEMGQLLENKVSNLMAQVRQLQKDIDGLNITIKENNIENLNLKQTINNLEEKIKGQRVEINNLNNENDRLKKQGGDLSRIEFDKLNSNINIITTENQQKTSKIKQLEADLQRMVQALKDFHQRMVKLDGYTKFQTNQLQELVDQKIQEQANRIQQVTETFKEALMLSNKTYFLEEVNKHKTEKKNLKKEIEVLVEQIRILKKSQTQFDQQIEYLQNQNNQLLTQIASAGKSQIDQDAYILTSQNPQITEGSVDNNMIKEQSKKSIQSMASINKPIQYQQFNTFGVNSPKEFQESPQNNISSFKQDSPEQNQNQAFQRSQTISMKQTNKFKNAKGKQSQLNFILYFPENQGTSEQTEKMKYSGRIMKQANTVTNLDDLIIQEEVYSENKSSNDD